MARYVRLFTKNVIETLVYRNLIKMKALFRSLFLVLFISGAQTDLRADHDVLKQLQLASNLQLEKQFVKQAGREMFNNAVDWQNWC